MRCWPISSFIHRGSKKEALLGAIDSIHKKVDVLSEEPLSPKGFTNIKRFITTKAK